METEETNVADLHDLDVFFYLEVLLNCKWLEKNQM